MSGRRDCGGLGAELDKILLSADVCARFFREYGANARFRERLHCILPEIELCIRQPQNSVWHIYPVMEHILHSVEEMNRLSRSLPDGERRILAYTMFFHDLGKPACHSVKIVDGTPRDSFAFHNLESEKIAARALPFFGFGEGETAKIARLVRDHDIFLLLTEHPVKPWQIRLTPQFLKDYIAELGAYGDGRAVFDDLLMVGIADNRAQNPAMTGEPLAFIEKIRAMANEIA